MRLFQSPVYWIVKIFAILVGAWILYWYYVVDVYPDIIHGSEYFHKQFRSPCSNVEGWKKTSEERLNYFNSRLEELMEAEGQHFNSIFKEISCEGNFGLYQFLYGGAEPDSISEHTKRNIIAVLETWMHSQMMKDTLMPWTSKLSHLIGPGKLKGKTVPGFLTALEMQLNEDHVCEGQYALGIRRRAVIRQLKNFKHDFNPIHRIIDKYEFRLFWFHGNPKGKPDRVIALHGSNIETADLLKIELANLPWMDNAGDKNCLMYSLDLTLFLGSGGLLIHDPKPRPQ